MANLNKDLENLRKLNNLRDRAKELRELALIPLRKIEDINVPAGIEQIDLNEKDKKDFLVNFEHWLCSEDQVEIALLAKVQNNRDINKDNDVNINAEASKRLKDKLANTRLQDLFNLSREPVNSEHPVPVLTAAFTMQALVSRAETVFSRASMVCYYRIVRELYEANPPDWMVGAARVGSGGRASAFVTSECVRAISAFQKSIVRTNEFMDHTRRLLEDYSNLSEMMTCLGDPDEDHPLKKWADKTIEAIGLDCYLSTNPRRRQIAISKFDEKDRKNKIISNQLRIFSEERTSNLDVAVVAKYFSTLGANFHAAISRVKDEIELALEEIDRLRIREELLTHPHDEKFHLSESAHRFARRAIDSARTEADKYLEYHSAQHEVLRALDDGDVQKERIKLLKNLIEHLRVQGEGIAARILKTLEPTKKYLNNVIYRELSANKHDFDAGQLVFAATALGAMTNWRDNDLLRRASELLVEALPENGKMSTLHPFHTNRSGYRLLPVEFEMSRSMAQLFEKTDFPITPETVDRILSIFEDNQIPFCTSRGDRIIGWNFIGSPTPNSPSVWATAVSVIALDRVVRMLNARINKAVLGHFEVLWADKRRSDMKLYDLIYSDHGFSSYPGNLRTEFYKKGAKKKDMSIALYLQLMRAHVMRAALPEEYRDTGSEEKIPKIYSAILYGPPGTGKTTFAEALALSSHKAVVYLSPSDLVVQGQELMEGRARDVFEALSMLSQVVIIFDEFEEVVKNRRGTGNRAMEPTGVSRDEYGQLKVAQQIDRQLLLFEQLVNKDDPKLRFLLGGMLPKLIKLNKSAKENSFVYFMGTNYLKIIDEAAQRPGRFDTKLPVYNACPLSRAGALLYRINKEKPENYKFEDGWVTRFLNLLQRTAFEPASELAQRFFNKRSDYFDYVLNNHEFDDEPVNIFDEDEKLPTTSDYDDIELCERHWLINFEKQFRRHVEDNKLHLFVNKNEIDTPAKLKQYLTPPVEVGDDAGNGNAK